MTRAHTVTSRWMALAPALWLAAFVLLPGLMVLRLSFAPAGSGPAGGAGVDLAAYARLVTDGLYREAYVSSLGFAAAGTACCLLLGYPMAWAIARSAPDVRRVLMLAVLLPFWTSFLIRAYAWMAILKPAGLLNQALEAVGLPPQAMLGGPAAVGLGLAYAYLPFMILPIEAALAKQDASLIEAAADLGAAPWRRFWRITLPLSLPGVAAGCLLCFVPMLGEYVIPDLLGGTRTLTLGKVIWAEFFANRDPAAASAVAVVLLTSLLVPLLLCQRRATGKEASR
jgi:putrescine transport system permease protein